MLPAGPLMGETIKPMNAPAIMRAKFKHRFQYRAVDTGVSNNAALPNLPLAGLKLWLDERHDIPKLWPA